MFVSRQGQTYPVKFSPNNEKVIFIVSTGEPLSKKCYYALKYAWLAIAAILDMVFFLVIRHSSFHPSSPPGFEVTKSAPNRSVFIQVLNIIGMTFSDIKSLSECSIATHFTYPHLRSIKFRYFSRFNCFTKIDSI